MFFLLYEHTDNGVFDFPKISDHFPKISNEFKYNLRDKPDISEIIDIFTCEDIVSFLSICYHSVYQWPLYNKEYKEITIINPTHNKGYKTKKSFTGFYTEINPC